MATRTEKNKDKQNEIIQEENREKRKRAIIFGLKLTIIIVVSMSLIFLYTDAIATKKIIVKEERIISDKLQDNFNGTKIIQISDIHYGTTIFNEEVDELVKIVNRRKPDIIVFTGDLIDQNYKISLKEQEKLIKSLKKLDASIGKYAVMGEEDGENFTTIFNQSEFTILNNSYDLIYNDSNNPILLIGLSSSLKDAINIDNAYKYFKEESHNSNIYTITLLHEPDSIDDILSNYQTDLFLAGHSHNGQINIPYIGSLITKEGAKKYNKEFYQLENSKVYISSGIGTNGNGFRLFDHPSINFLRLSNK